MIYTELTKKALKLCFKVHKRQVDKSGIPYVFHPYHLAEQMDNEIAVVCALLHDAVESPECDFKFLKESGFPDEVINVLKLLVHDKNVPYSEYINDIGKNPIAKQVKIADLKHNADLSRLGKTDEDTLKRIKKYKATIKILSKE